MFLIELYAKQEVLKDSFGNQIIHITIPCLKCKTKYEGEFKLADDITKITHENVDILIANKNNSRSDRELFISGICPKCWLIDPEDEDFEAPPLKIFKEIIPLNYFDDEEYDPNDVFA
ncbi:MAG: hypothetical protein GXX85_00510 [Ignavibacteria bacterium]|mgnify:CR=1 FL=1|nr:hypothetical protein [Ignavibacteria bacterium]